jgi:hypothetical protein
MTKKVKIGTSNDKVYRSSLKLNFSMFPFNEIKVKLLEKILNTNEKLGRQLLKSKLVKMHKENKIKKNHQQYKK